MSQTKRNHSDAGTNDGARNKIAKMNINKKTNFFRKGQTKRFMEVGHRGFMATTNFREKECVRECYNILNQYADEMYGADDSTKPKTVEAATVTTIPANEKLTADPSSDDQEDEEEEEDIATKLENDIRASVVAAKSKERRFQQVETGCSNCVFIRTTLTDPVQLAARIVNDLSATHKAITRNVLRFLPVESVCKANVTDIVNAAGPLFDKHFLNAPATTFSVVYNKRCNETVKRDEIINELAQLVSLKNMTHKVDLKNAHYSIVVEVVKGLCCLSVVPEYMQMKKYNLTELSVPPPRPTDNVANGAAKVTDGEAASQAVKTVSEATVEAVSEAAVEAVSKAAVETVSETTVKSVTEAVETVTAIAAEIAPVDVAKEVSVAATAVE